MLAPACLAAGTHEVLASDVALLVEKATAVAVDRNLLFFVADDFSVGGAAEFCLRRLETLGVTHVLLATLGGLPPAGYPLAGNAVKLTQAAQCRQPEQRRTMSCWRLFLMTELLKHEFNVFLSDLDVVFSFDPFKYLDTARRYDVSVMSDGMNFAQLAYMNLPPGGTAFGKILDPAQKVPFLWEQNVAIFNVGTMMVRGTADAVRTFEVIKHWLSNTSYWEQQVVSLQLLSFALQGVIRLKVWDPRTVANSGFWVNFNATLVHPPVAFHASGHGEKLEMMQRFAAATYPIAEPFDGIYMVDFEGPYAVKL